MTSFIDRGAPHVGGNDVSAATVVCAICQAVYAPAQGQENLLQAPPIALESAFMSMCHFCFRCRRPACPACWDGVHGICGACDEEVNLPFRTQVRPLAGTFSMPHTPTTAPAEPPIAAELRCIQAGRFQSPHAPIDKASTSPIPTSVTSATKQEVRSGREQNVYRGQEIPSVQLQRKATALEEKRGRDVDEIETRPDSGKPTRRRNGWRILLGVFLIALSLLIILIAVALWSNDVNAFIARFVQINIQVEVERLLRLFPVP